MAHEFAGRVVVPAAAADGRARSGRARPGGTGDTVVAVSRPARPPEDDAASATLLGRIRAGDRTAVDDLYERYRRPAFGLTRRILADDALAEDVLQEVFLAV